MYFPRLNPRILRSDLARHHVVGFYINEARSPEYAPGNHVALRKDCELGTPHCFACSTRALVWLFSQKSLPFDDRPSVGHARFTLEAVLLSLYCGSGFSNIRRIDSSICHGL